MLTSRRKIPSRLTTMDEINLARKTEKIQKEQQDHEAALAELWQAYDTKKSEIYTFNPSLDTFLKGPCVFNEMPPTPTDKSLPKGSEPKINPTARLEANGFFPKTAPKAPEQKKVEQKSQNTLLRR